MDEKDGEIQRLSRQVEHWKELATEAADKACFECERLDVDCNKCRMTKIRKEAGKMTL